jgi:predicted aldo/keto reductase-like oxidoreductase
MYRDSEAKIGQALSDVRKNIVIATKTTRRDAAGLREHLEKSLQKLKTDYLDLYQFHQVANDVEWNKITQEGGAWDEAQKAKAEGKIRFLGVTSHNLAMAIKLAKTGLFSTVQFPFNFIEPEAKDELHVYAQANGIGSIVMKPFAGGVIDNAALAFKYLRQFTDIIPIPGYDSVQSVNEIVSIYDSPNIVKSQDLAAMDKYRQELGREFCRRCEYCQPCQQGVIITPAMGYPIVASRMSPKVSVEFLKVAMESTQKCTECGECIERCPYELPIPEILKRNYDLFEAHRAENKL